MELYIVLAQTFPKAQAVIRVFFNENNGRAESTRKLPSLAIRKKQSNPESKSFRPRLNRGPPVCQTSVITNYATKPTGHIYPTQNNRYLHSAELLWIPKTTPCELSNQGALAGPISDSRHHPTMRKGQSWQKKRILLIVTPPYPRWPKPGTVHLRKRNHRAV